MKHTKCERTHEQPTKYVAISIQVTIIKNVSGDIPLLLQELKHALGSLTMHTGRQTKDRQIDTHTDRQADKQAHRQTDTQTGTHTERQTPSPLAGSGGSYDATTQQLEVQGDHTVRARPRTYR